MSSRRPSFDDLDIILFCVVVLGSCLWAILRFASLIFSW